jgi:hypothetical protein
MLMHKTKATIIGLLDISNVNKWIVMEKLGSLVKYKSTPKAGKKWLCTLFIPRGFRFCCRVDVCLVRSYLFLVSLRSQGPC